MSAYPFGRMPTLREFIDYAKEPGCKLKVLRNKSSESGSIVSCYILGRTGVPLLLANIELNDRLTPSVLRSHERTLQIPSYLKSQE